MVAEAISFKAGQSEAAGAFFATNGFAPTLQSANNGSTAVPAVAFEPSHHTRGKDGAPSEVFPPLSADADKGDQDAVMLAVYANVGAAQVASTLRQRRPGESGFSTDVDSVVIGWRASDQANAEVMIDAAGTLNCNDGQRGGFIWPQEAADPITAHKGKTYTHEGKVFRTRNVVPSLRYPEVPDVCGTVADGAHHGGGLNGQDAYTGRILPVIAEEVDPYNGTTTGDVAIGLRVGNMSVGSLPAVLTPEASPALTAAYARGTGARADSGVTRCVVNARASMVVRRLTPRECERLQGFPDDYTLVPHRGKPAADGNRYKALGNSMAVNVMRWLGERIALSERAHRETHAIDCDLDEDCMCAASTW